MPVADLVEVRGDGFGIELVFLQTALPLFFFSLFLPKPLPFAAALRLIFGFARILLNN